MIELCEIFANKTGKLVARSAMCSGLQKFGLNGNKKPSTLAGTNRVLNLRLDYWEKVKHIEPENLVFLDETGILIDLTRTHARSQYGIRTYCYCTS